MSGKVFFEALDSKGDSSLWVSDGTPTGTSEVGGGGNAGVTGVGATGLTPNNLVGFGGNAMFWSTDSNNTLSLWSTDGTVSGTKEVGVANPGLLGNLVGAAVFGDATVIGDEILYSGYDSTSSTQSLWVTNGTSAGTTEVGGTENQGVSGISAMHPIEVQGNMASIGSKAIFVTADSGNNNTLWVSNGTAAGTTEIGGLNNAGVANAPTTGLNPSLSGIYSLGKVAVFFNQDSSGNYGVWSTNGTAAGTVELASLGALNLAGDINALNTNETSTYSGILFFESGDDLWVTNGTVAGTKDIGQPSGTISNVTTFFGGAVWEATSGGVLGLGTTHGLWATNGSPNNTWEVGGTNNAGVAGAPTTGLQIIKSVSFGNDVVFTALDSSGITGLWMSDGTTNGTYEIGGLKDAGVAGANALGLTPTNLTVAGGNVFFTALDSTGKYGLWETDGTKAGTQELSTTANTLLGLVSTEVQTIASAWPLGDIFNGGGQNITNANEFTNYNFLNNTGPTWDTVTLSDDNLFLDNASASLIGGSNVANFTNGIDAVSLYQTGNNWDTVNGSNGAVTASASKVSVLGGGDNLYGSKGSWFSLYQTNGNWDTMNGSDENVILNTAQASLVGADNFVTMFQNSWISLYQTNNDWDTITGSGGNLILNSAQASIFGGSDLIQALGGSSMSLYQTVGNWDKVQGSGATVIMNAAQSSIFGGSNTIYENGGSASSLYATGGNWDLVVGSGQTVTLNSSQATVIGNNNFIYMQGASTATLSGSGDHVVTSQALGQQYLTGFGSTDTMQFSAADFASFSALQGAMSTSGTSTVITLDADDSVTLFNTQKSALTASQFTFV
jgi:hypothetical protein